MIDPQSRRTCEEIVFGERPSGPPQVLTSVCQPSSWISDSPFGAMNGFRGVLGIPRIGFGVAAAPTNGGGAGTATDGIGTAGCSLDGARERERHRERARARGPGECHPPDQSL